MSFFWHCSASAVCLVFTTQFGRCFRSINKCDVLYSPDESGSVLDLITVVVAGAMQGVGCLHHAPWLQFARSVRMPPPSFDCTQSEYSRSFASV